MAALIHLDTHVVVWLWLKDMRRLRPMKRALEASPLACAPAAELELQFLREIGRLRDPVTSIVAGLRETIGLQRSNASFGQVIDCARELGWTRDPLDRLIVGTAMADAADLLTADETILANFPRARNR